jgi:glycosyltransferase involved in cell wall biosynthesis
VRILIWHVHGSWTTAFVQGRHEYLVPVLPDRGPDGRGRARTWDWPASVVEVPPAGLRDADIDAVIVQRPEELDLARAWTGRAPGGELPTVFLEHNAPEPHPVNSRHPVADRTDIPLVHVTNFNRLFWDSGRAPTTVIEHGVVDPGDRYGGELPVSAVVINEAARRGRMVGADLLDTFAQVAPVDVFGMGETRRAGRVRCLGDVPQNAMHSQLARRRLYLHPTRWTSLGLSLMEAMHVAMPIVAVAATEVVEAVPSAAGVISTDVERLTRAVREYVNEPEAARLAGKTARAYALQRYGLDRFLADWDRLLEEVTR